MMSKINWKVRIRNERFWLSMIPMALLLIEQFAALFGYKIDLGALGNQLKDIVETVFVILGLVGVINDPTTATYADSKKAMTYEQPKFDFKFKEE